MKIDFKKTAAMLCAAVMAVSMCGCADNGTIMTVDGMTIRNGIYLYYQRSAYSNAQAAFEKEQAENAEKESDTSDTSADTSDASSDASDTTSESSDTSDTSETPVLLDQTIEGKTASQWIKEDTLKQVREFVAVQRLCDEKGVSLTDDELNSVNSDIKSMWDDENYYVQYLYGFKTMGEYYESIGIAKESVKQIYMVDTLQTKLFSKFYDKDGETPVSDEELTQFLKDNYVSVKAIKFSFTDSEGNELTEDSDKEVIVESAKEYADRINNGESIIDIKYDIDLKAEQEKQKPSIEEYYNENGINDMSLAEYTEQELAKVTVDKLESADDLDTVFNKNMSSFSDDMTEYILGLAADGKASVYTDKDNSYAYLIVRENVTGKTSWLEKNRTGVLMAMKSDDFETSLEQTGLNYSVDVNSYLVDSKYSPEKLRTNG